MDLEKIDPEGKLYVLRSGKGFSCYGWTVLDRKARAVAAWLAAPDTPNRDASRAAVTWLAELDKNPPGTADHFQICNNILDRASVHCSVFGDRCSAELVPALVGLEGKRVEADYFGERIRFWVGRSTGWMPVHLRIHSKRSQHGEVLVAEHVKNVRVIR
jgi:hypothetical protein